MMLPFSVVSIRFYTRFTHSVHHWFISFSPGSFSFLICFPSCMCFEPTLQFANSTCYALLFYISQSYCKHVSTLLRVCFIILLPLLLPHFLTTWLFHFKLWTRKETHTSWLIHLTGFWIFNFLFTLDPWIFSLQRRRFPIYLKTLRQFHTKDLLSLFSLFRNVLLITFFFKFMTAHAFWFAHAPCARPPFSLPHVWLDRPVYTYKFTFYYNILTTHVSFLYASDDFRLPTTSDDDIGTTVWFTGGGILCGAPIDPQCC